MSRLLRFLRLPILGQVFLVKTYLLVWTIRLALWLLPFNNVRRRVEKHAVLTKERKSKLQPIERIVRAVEITARYVPGATCLTQALTALILLRREGHEATPRIGVLLVKTGGIKAHAWVECQGKIVIGDLPTMNDFTPLPALEKGGPG